MLLAHVAHKKRDENGDEKVAGAVAALGFSFLAMANQETCDERDFGAPLPDAPATLRLHWPLRLTRPGKACFAKLNCQKIN